MTMRCLSPRPLTISRGRLSLEVLESRLPVSETIGTSLAGPHYRASARPWFATLNAMVSACHPEWAAGDARSSKARRSSLRAEEPMNSEPSNDRVIR